MCRTLAITFYRNTVTNLDVQGGVIRSPTNQGPTSSFVPMPTSSLGGIPVYITVIWFT